jgi:isochorismate synthase
MTGRTDERAGGGKPPEADPLIDSETAAEIERVCKEARERSFRSGEPVLATVAVRVPGVPALRFLESLDSLAVAGWWSAPEIEVAGAGVAAEVTAEGTNRFSDLSDGLESIFADAVTSGREPLALVGTAFDERDPGHAWPGFACAHAFVPGIELLREDDFSTLVVSVSVTADDVAGEDKLAGAIEEGMRAIEAAGIEEAPVAPMEVPLEVGYTPDRIAWDAAVASALGAMEAGHLRKVVLARRRSFETREPWSAIRIANALEERYPDAYCYLAIRGDVAFIGASPELLVSLRNGIVRSTPAAGTVPGGDTYRENRHLAGGLDTPKARLEQELVTESVYSTFLVFCHDISVTLPAVTPAGPVQHLQTTLEGHLTREATVMQIAADLQPTPAVGGLPRAEALRHISEHEGFDRGWYSGAIGAVGSDGSGSLAVALRCALVSPGRIDIFAGAGIVEGSDAAEERAEVDMKLGVVGEVIASLVRG